MIKIYIQSNIEIILLTFEIKWYVNLVLLRQGHYSDIIMSMIASQITSPMTVYSAADQRKHQNSVSLALVQRIHRWPVNSPHKGPVTWKMFPFDDVIMDKINATLGSRASAAMVLSRPCSINGSMSSMRTDLNSLHYSKDKKIGNSYIHFFSFLWRIRYIKR